MLFRSPHRDGVPFYQGLCLICQLKRDHLVPEYDDDGQDGSQLYDDEKHFLERIAHIERNEFVDEKHVSRAADRQPFGDTLHDTKKNYF